MQPLFDQPPVNFKTPKRSFEFSFAFETMWIAILAIPINERKSFTFKPSIGPLFFLSHIKKRSL